MKDEKKAKKQLLQQVVTLRQRINELENSKTERKNPEEDLRESEERFRALMEQSPIAIQVMTPYGKIVQINDAYTKLWGVSRKELKPLHEKYNILKDDQVKRLGLMPYVKRAFAGEALSLPPFEYEPKKTRATRIKARKRWIQSRIYPVKGKNGEIRNVVMMHEDITERKRAEEKLKQYSERLEEMVEERTKELRDAQEQLVRKEKLAVLGELAAGVAHELRNPLGAIKNAAYFLSMALQEPEPEVKETLEILEKEVATSESIINGLLDFACPKPPALRKVDVNHIVQEALARIKVPENIQVVSQLDQALPNILADTDQLAQVFSNLILNAVQAMPDGGKLTVKSEVPTPQWVSVSFADTGVGIPRENLGSLFEPVFATKAKGIGLSIVRGIIENHDGKISVRSEVGRGTTFTLRFPLKTDSPQEENK